MFLWIVCNSRYTHATQFVSPVSYLTGGISGIDFRFREKNSYPLEHRVARFELSAIAKYFALRASKPSLGVSVPLI
jgi:hypothetical protein